MPNNSSTHTALAIAKSTLAFNADEVLMSHDPSDRDRKILAEGDSWFDYMLVPDIVDHLRDMGYGVKKQSRRGDTLENMVYGTNTEGPDDNSTNPGPMDLSATLEALCLYKPRFVLLSAGGNDIVGPEIVQYLFHKRSAPKDILNEARFRAHVNGPMRDAILHFLKAVFEASGHESVDVLLHGYAYAKPNGKGYRILVQLAGPWIRPGFVSKGWEDRVGEMEPTIKRLVDIFNDMLQEVANSMPAVHYVDLRDRFHAEEDWHNEIHLRGSCYKEVAQVFAKRMASILGHNPLPAGFTQQSLLTGIDA